MICDERGPWVATASGGRFYLADPDPADIKVEDVVLSLSKVCRFAGQLKPEFRYDIYSVAQHSAYVWYLVKYVWGETQAAKWALTHDWLEAFYGDNISPVKALVPDLKKYEKEAQTRFIHHAGIPYDEHIATVVHKADLTVGYIEAGLLQDVDVAAAWHIGFVPEETMEDLDGAFMCWDPRSAQSALRDAIIEEFGDALP